MSSGLRVIGAGLPRTGTSSLKLMLERLLGGPCYHMKELYARPEVDGPRWTAALNGDHAALDLLLDGWVAAVDWPASALWRELAERHPDAIVVLSHRTDSAEWWASADKTVWHIMREVRALRIPEHVDGIHHLLRRVAGFNEDMDERSARDRYDQHFAEVVDSIPADRLMLWKPTDGWEPLCAGLGLPVPEEDPSHANTSGEFRARFGQID